MSRFGYGYARAVDRFLRQMQLGAKTLWLWRYDAATAGTVL